MTQACRGCRGHGVVSPSMYEISRLVDPNICNDRSWNASESQIYPSAFKTQLDDAHWTPSASCWCAAQQQWTQPLCVACEAVARSVCTTRRAQIFHRSTAACLTPSITDAQVKLKTSALLPLLVHRSGQVFLTGWMMMMMMVMLRPCLKGFS